mgnify:FL=1|jgi:hypothetical protein
MTQNISCPNESILKIISSSLDRLEEAAWFIQMMEENYHKANKFRWSLNSFIRALKEVEQLLVMELQQQKEISAWFKSEKEALSQKPFIAKLFEHRNYIVHKSMLTPQSKGTVGFTRGRGLKLGLSVPINPLADSQDAIIRYIRHAAETQDFLGILYTEEDGGGEYTCVQREWRLNDFPDEELTQLAAQAWQTVAKLALDTATKLGANVIEPKIELGDPNQVQFEIYSPDWVKAHLEEAKKSLKNSN